MVGAVNPTSFINILLFRWPMAKRKMYKDLSFVNVENLGSSGAPVPVCKIQKQQGQMSSAFIKNVRIHSIVNDVSGGSSPASDMPLNIMWYATTTDSSNPSADNVIAAAATTYGGGSVNLTLNRRIMDNSYDADSGFGAICIWAETTDATFSADIFLKNVIESYGRWHEVLTE